MEQKIDALLAQMSLGEKASLLGGADTWGTAAIERLDISPIQVSDGIYELAG